MKTYIQWIIKYRHAVIALALLLTGVAVYQMKNLHVVIDTNTMLPRSHPYISTGIAVEKLFGSKYSVVVGISPKQGDIYQTQVLDKVSQITAAFAQTPGVVKDNLLSLSARRAKNIVGSAEGLDVKPLMPQVPQTPAQMQALRNAVQGNSIYHDAIVSKDQRTTAVIVEFKEEPGGYRAIMNKVDPVVAAAADESLNIYVGGAPRFIALIEAYSERMGFLLPIAVVVLSLVLFTAFRSRQGMVLPLVTGLISVAWGVGVMGATGIPMDVFNATTPILILAVATGHAVQMLKRYYEEYARLQASTVPSPSVPLPEGEGSQSPSPSGRGVGVRASGATSQDMLNNHEAIVRSLVRVGPVMMVAGGVAALGFFSLIVFDISTVRTFGIFTGIGILATLMVEMTLIPALRAVLAPPGLKETQRRDTEGFWDQVALRIARLTTGAQRKRVYIGAALFVVFALVGMSRVVVDNSMKTFFSPQLDLIQDDQQLNQRLGGTNTVYLLIEGATDGVIKRPQTLAAMDALQRFVEAQPEVGKTVSLADLVKRMNQAMHGDDPAFFKIPDSAALVAQYLLLYSLSGEPADFDAYVDYGYRNASITLYIKSDSTAGFEQLAEKIRTFAAARFENDVRVRIGGGLAEGAALSEVMVHGKVLNIVQIAGVVFLIACLVFRSLVAGLLVLLPLLVAVLANFGLIGWTGIPLNVSTALISAMAVGIGADYAIYLIYRIREELETGASAVAAVHHVVLTAGKAILYVALAVAAGYGVLLLSFGFHIHQWLAILIGVAMLVSALAALLLIPTLVLAFKPAFIFRRMGAELGALGRV